MCVPKSKIDTDRRWCRTTDAIGGGKWLAVTRLTRLEAKRSLVGNGLHCGRPDRKSGWGGCFWYQRSDELGRGRVWGPGGVSTGRGMTAGGRHVAGMMDGD